MSDLLYQLYMHPFASLWFSMTGFPGSPRGYLAPINLLLSTCTVVPVLTSITEKCISSFPSVTIFSILLFMAYSVAISIVSNPVSEITLFPAFLNTLDNSIPLSMDLVDKKTRYLMLSSGSETPYLFSLAIMIDSTSIANPVDGQSWPNLPI